jgi:hypothetical protein
MPASLPPTFYEDSQRPKRLAGRERLIAGGLAAFCIAVVVIVVISFASTNTVGRGCIDLDVPGAFGADVVKACGQDARELCTQLRASDALTSDDVVQIASACRKAGLAVKVLPPARVGI